MRIIELFAGIGACSKALAKLDIKHEVVDAVEIDKYAIKSFNAIHNTNFEPQDITKWDKDVKDIDLIMHGSPCQDFSVAGNQAGGDLGSGTRSSLMYETIRIVGKIRPKYVVWENVKNIMSAKHKHNFDKYIDTLNTLGYNSYYQVLNAKDYGIAQNRERVFTVSIRKDIDNEEFVFPEKISLKLRLRDFLDEYVDEKYYLKNEKITKIENSNFMQERKMIQEKDYCDTLLARDYKDPKCVRVGGIFDTETTHHQAGSVYDSNGLAPTLDTMQGGWRQPCIEENEGQSGLIQPIDRKYKEHNKQREEHIEFKNDNCSHSLRTSVLPVVCNKYRIRKLTPRECWRLMGFSDLDFEKAMKVPTSNTQLYKQAGNSIVVNVLEEIFRNLFREEMKDE